VVRLDTVLDAAKGDREVGFGVSEGAVGKICRRWLAAARARRRARRAKGKTSNAT